MVERPATSSSGAIGGLLTGGYEDSTDNEDGSEAADNPPTIFLQRVRSVDGRSEPATGAAFGLLSSGPLGLLTVFIGGRGEFPFAGELERHRLPDLDVGRHFHVGVRLSREGRRRIGIGPRRGELHRLGSDRNKMLQRVHQFGIDVDAAGVRKRVDDVEAGLAGTQRK